MPRLVQCAVHLADLFDRSGACRLADALDGAMMSKCKLHLMQTVARLLDEVRSRYKAGDPTIDRRSAEWFLDLYDNQHLLPSGQVGDHWASNSLQAILDGPEDAGFDDPELDDPVA